MAGATFLDDAQLPRLPRYPDNLVSRVTIGANRNVDHSSGQALAVDALTINRRDPGMAFTASGGNINTID